MYEKYERSQSNIEGTIVHSWANNYSNAAIVFIHGLSGDAVKTWGELPHLLMGTAFSRNKDIISYGYKSNKFWLTNRSYEILQDELITFCETILSRYQKIYFITHSLGSVLTLGLIPSLRDKDELWQKKLRGVILLAPAIWGSSLAYFTFSKLARQLRPKSELLKNINNNWKAYCLSHNFSATIIFGTKDKILLKKKEELTKLKLIPKSVTKNHINIPKIKNVNDLLFRTIVNCLYSFDNANYYDSRNYILQIVFDSDKKQWDYDNVLSELIYLPDFDIRIELLNDSIPFKEKWTDRYPDKTAFHYEYQVTYKGLKVHKFSVIIVDGGRYAIPQPKWESVGGYKLSPQKYNLGIIIEKMGAYENFEQGFKLSGITIDHSI